MNDIVQQLRDLYATHPVVMKAANKIEHMNDEMILPRHYGLVPESMAEAMKLAEMMASAKLVPAALQNSPSDCLMVIQQAIRWDMDPFAVAQECSVIQGKLMHSGKLVAAVVNARGNLTRRLSFEYRGDGDNRTIKVSGQLHGEGEPRVVEVIFKNARTANTMWQKQPDQQLMYHGARVWARRHTPELMLGVWSKEEFDDNGEEFDDIPVQHRRPPPPAPNVMENPVQVSGIPHNPDTGELPDEAPPTGEAPIMAIAREAAMRGEAAFREFYKQCSPEERETIKPFGEQLRGLMS